MIPFPLHLMFQSELDIQSFGAYITPASIVDCETGGLAYPPRKIWWKYFREYQKRNVVCYPFSLQKNSPVLFYRSNLKSSDWCSEHLYAAIVPHGVEAVMHCKVDLKEEFVVFNFDPTIYNLSYEEQSELCYYLNPSVELKYSIWFCVIIFMILFLLCTI